MSLGILTYLWSIGGNLCLNSILEGEEITVKAGRFDAQASHSVKRRSTTEKIEIIEPTLAKKLNPI